MLILNLFKCRDVDIVDSDAMRQVKCDGVKVKIMDIETVRRKALAAFLKQKRAEYGWSQRELAQRIKSTQNAVYLWETEKATPDTANLDKIASLFGLKTWQLLRSLEDNQQVTGSGFEDALNALNRMSRAEIAQIVNVGVQKLAQAA
jgi:ribosome-binding protein aMBF1 (putative translation factor)